MFNQNCSNTQLQIANGVLKKKKHKYQQLHTHKTGKGTPNGAKMQAQAHIRSRHKFICDNVYSIMRWMIYIWYGCRFMCVKCTMVQIYSCILCYSLTRCVFILLSKWILIFWYVLLDRFFFFSFVSFSFYLIVFSLSSSRLVIIWPLSLSLFVARWIAFHRWMFAVVVVV